MENKGEMVTVNEAELREVLLYMKRLAAENSEIKKEIAFLKKDSHRNSVMRALGC